MKRTCLRINTNTNENSKHGVPYDLKPKNYLRMKKIGILSDTHGFLHRETERIFQSCDEIWHAGDFGSIEVVKELQSFKPLIGVYGNIDGAWIREEFKEMETFSCEAVTVLMKHIGGYPGKYEKSMKDAIMHHSPKLVISGHSHILKVVYDKHFNHLHINPGAAGRYGFHATITMIRIAIDGTQIKDLEVVEFPK